MVFVDVGGGRSRQCVALRNEFPRLKGRFVLQDLREAVEGLGMEGVEVQVGNFWGVQSVNVCRFDSPVFGFDLQSLKSEILDSYMLC